MEDWELVRLVAGWGVFALGTTVLCLWVAWGRVGLESPDSTKQAAEDSGRMETPDR